MYKYQVTYINSGSVTTELILDDFEVTSDMPREEFVRQLCASGLQNPYLFTEDEWIIPGAITRVREIKQ